MDKFFITVIISLFKDLSIVKVIILLVFFIFLTVLRYLYRIKLVEMASKKPMKIKDGKKFTLDSTNIDEDIKNPQRKIK